MKHSHFKKSTFFSLLVVALLITSCANTEPESSSDQHNHVEENEVVEVSLAQFEASDFVLGNIETKKINEAISTNGVFEVAPENKAVVSAFFGGFVKKIHLLPGKKVVKGQTVAVLENPEYAKLQQEYLAVKSNLVHLKSEFERQRNLVADKSTAQKNAVKAEADYNMALSSFQSLKKQLAMMNIDPESLTIANISTEIKVKTPISGYVTSVGAETGIYLNAQSPIVTIINTDHMHLELNIYEKDLQDVRIGQTIKFHVQNKIHEEHYGTVYLINQEIDEARRTVRIHGHVEDEHTEEIFIPGMYIEAQIFTSEKEIMALPEEAIINLDDENYVLILDSKNDHGYHFKKQKVVLGNTYKGFVEIVNAADVSKSKKILTKGAFGLLSDGNAGGHSH